MVIAFGDRHVFNFQPRIAKWNYPNEDNYTSKDRIVPKKSLLATVGRVWLKLVAFPSQSTAVTANLSAPRNFSHCSSDLHESLLPWQTSLTLLHITAVTNVISLYSAHTYHDHKNPSRQGNPAHKCRPETLPSFPDSQLFHLQIRGTGQRATRRYETYV